MVRQVNLYDAKTHLSQLVEDAAKGEEIVIAKNGKPLAKLVVATPANEEKPAKRVGGQWAKYLTPEQIADIGSEAWWRRWKDADAEIERDFEDPKQDSGWTDTSSIPMPSSISKAIRKSSAGKRARSSRTRKTRSS